MDKPQDYVGKAQEAVRSAADTAQGYAQDAYENSGRYASQAQDAVRGAAGSAAEYAQDAYNNPGRYMRQGQNALEHQVEENPLIALLVAGAIGYGLAMLIHGRR